MKEKYVKAHFVSEGWLDNEDYYDEQYFYDALCEYARQELSDTKILIDAIYKQIKLYEERAQQNE